MEFKDVVKNRYSCKKFSAKQVEGEKLTAILEAGRLAPTAKNLQEQHVYVSPMRLWPRLMQLHRAVTARPLSWSLPMIRLMCSPIRAASGIPAWRTRRS